MLPAAGPFPYAVLRSAWGCVPTHLLVPTCSYAVVSGFEPRLQSASLSLSLSSSLFFSQVAVKRGGYLTCLCKPDYAALGRVGHRVFFHHL